jgi:hypothetical protein
MRTKCNTAKIPFFSFVCVTRHWAVDIPITEAYINWCVNTALAYGAKGINYFTYQMPEASDNFHDNDTAYIARDGGQKTSVYYRAQKVNRHVNRMGSVLVNSAVEKIMAIGSGSPANLYGHQNGFSAYKEVSSLSVSSGRVLCSILNRDGKTSVLVVNNSLTSPATFNIGFKSKVVANKHAYTSTSTFNGTSDSVTLAAGTSVLYEITNYVRG